MGFGTEPQLLPALGLVVSGPKRMRTMLGHVARAKGELYKASPGIKSQLAGEIKATLHVALAWLRHQTVPVIPIIGARKVSQLQDNPASLDLELSAEQLKSLDRASRLELGFLRVLTTKKWFVQSDMAACGIASCSKRGTSGRIVMQVPAFKRPA